MVQSGYDIYAAAGAQYTATAMGFDVTAASGSGILLELVNVTAASAILSGIELTSGENGEPPRLLRWRHNNDSAASVA